MRLLEGFLTQMKRKFLRYLPLFFRKIKTIHLKVLPPCTAPIPY